MLFCVFFVSVSCSSDNERINVPKITETQEETIIGFDQLKESTYPTIMQLAEKSFNFLIIANDIYKDIIDCIACCHASCKS